MAPAGVVAHLIHHAYPVIDDADLMSGVDAVLANGSVDEKNLFVSDGSGDGVLSAWIIGKTNLFRAAGRTSGGSR